jgi:hypothetical protein
VQAHLRAWNDGMGIVHMTLRYVPLTPLL